jgi:hypothetical protein
VLNERSMPAASDQRGMPIVAISLRRELPQRLSDASAPRHGASEPLRQLLRILRQSRGNRSATAENRGSVIRATMESLTAVTVAERTARASTIAISPT